MKKAIINCKIFTGDEVEHDKAILINDGIIVSVQKSVPEEYEKVDLHGKSITAGLIDLQMNGGEKLYFSQYPDEDTLADMSQACHKYGTAYFLPTLISSPHARILEAVRSVKKFMRDHPGSGVLGMHLEGPFINPEKRGTHNIHTVRKATDEEVEQIASYGKGVIRLMTIAPEMMTDSQIRLLQNSGITLSIGHSDLSYEEAQKYFTDSNIHLVTHLFNAMSDFSHRAPGIVGAALENEDVFTPIILDGHHTHFAAGRIAYKLKREKLLLTTDCAFLGRKVKTFDWGDFDAVLKNDSYINKEGHLAGSAISLREAVNNAVVHLHASVQDTLAMATGKVATALGLQNKTGFIKPGFSARFFVFDEDNIAGGQTLSIY